MNLIKSMDGNQGEAKKMAKILSREPKNGTSNGLIDHLDKTRQKQIKRSRRSNSRTACPLLSISTIEMS